MYRRLLAASAAAAFVLACGDEKRAPPDVTQPEIVSRSPAIGERHAPAGGPFRVTFSEPLDPASVDWSAVQVSQESGPVPASVSLSEDRKTLVIVPRVSMQTSSWGLIALSRSLRDPAGNSIAPEKEPWLFYLARWPLVGAGPVLSNGIMGDHVSLTFDAGSRPVVGGWQTETGARFTGTTWSLLPRVSTSSLALASDPAGRLWRVGQQWNATDSVRELVVERLDEEGEPVWTQVGSPLVEPSWISRARLAFGSEKDRPIVFSTSDEENPLAVSAWDGQSWTSKARLERRRWATFDLSQTATYGAPSFVWTYDDQGDVFAQLGDQGFSRLAVPRVPTSFPSLGAGPDGTAYLAFGHMVDGHEELLVERWTGSSWEPVGGVIESLPDGVWGEPSAVTVRDGGVYVAWIWESEGRRTLHVSRWDGKEWVRIGDSLNLKAEWKVQNAAIALSADGTPYVAWEERLPEETETGEWSAVVVRKLER